MLPFLAPLLAGLSTWAPVIGAGVSAVGGLISANSRREAEERAAAQPNITRNTIDLAKLRADAEANGFNPLTIIRSGGLAGYGVAEGPRLMPSGISPVGEFVQGIGGMFGAFGEVRRNQAEYDLTQAQIRNYDADSRYKSHMMRPPQYSAPTAGVTYGGWGGRTEPVFNDRPSVPADRELNLYNKWHVQGRMDPAQDVEDEYGDAVSWGYGVAKLALDAGKNARRWVDTFAPGFLDVGKWIRQNHPQLGAHLPSNGNEAPWYGDRGVSYDRGKTWSPLPP